LADVTVDHLCSAFLRRILRRMKELGLNKTELAKRMNVSRPYVVAVLSRDVNITFRTAAKLAKALQMDFVPELGLQDLSPELKSSGSELPAELQIVMPDGKRRSYHLV